jgi:hypothetical protein
VVREGVGARGRNDQSIVYAHMNNKKIKIKLKKKKRSSFRFSVLLY